MSALPVESEWAHDLEVSEHKPKILWIGCSDARVSDSMIWSGRIPGEVFVHRNIANQFHLTDINAVSVVTYGLSIGSIKEIHVVGHTDCGGVKACYQAARGKPPIPLNSVLWSWLGSLRALAALHITRSLDELAKINVQEQTKNVRLQLDLLGVRNVELKGFMYNIESRRLVPV